MNRISSLFVASALAILPIGAFAQQNAAPAKNAAPAAMTGTMPASIPPATGKTDTTAANVTQPAKTDTKTTAHGAKTEVHGMNSVKSHDAKANTVPSKTDLPAKS